MKLKILQSLYKKLLYLNLKELCCDFWLLLLNLDSILKSRDITLPTKVHLVKAIVFPVVKYGCESWTIKKAGAEELMLLNCSVREDS